VPFLAAAVVVGEAGVALVAAAAVVAELQDKSTKTLRRIPFLYCLIH
jgi:hypothetical protein